MGNYVFMCFFISIFTNFSLYPNWEPSWLSMGLIPSEYRFQRNSPMIGLIILSCFVNLFIGLLPQMGYSGSGFLPMMMLMGYDPGGDTGGLLNRRPITNPLSPLFTYMVFRICKVNMTVRQDWERLLPTCPILHYFCSGMDCPGNHLGRNESSSWIWREFIYLP